MNHKQIKEQNIIEDYLCHRLDSDLVDAFEEHLLFCAKCRRDLLKQETLIASIQKAAYAEQHDHRNNGADKQKLRINDHQPINHEYGNDEAQSGRRKNNDRYRLLRIAAVITVLIVSASLLGMFLNRSSSHVNSNAGILQNTLKLFKNIYSWNKSFYLKSINRLVTEDIYFRYHLNEQPNFQGIELLDELIYDQHRNKKLPIRANTPFLDENMASDINGFVAVRYNVICIVPQILQNGRVFLRLFSNNTQDYYDDKILAESQIYATERNRDVYTFSIIQKLKLPRGLYYFTIERKNADPLFIGRFYVDALNSR